MEIENSTIIYSEALHRGMWVCDDSRRRRLARRRGTKTERSGLSDRRVLVLYLLQLRQTTFGVLKSVSSESERLLPGVARAFVRLASGNLDEVIDVLREFRFHVVQSGEEESGVLVRLLLARLVLAELAESIAGGRQDLTYVFFNFVESFEPVQRYGRHLRR